MPNRVHKTSKNALLLLTGTVGRLGMSFALVAFLGKQLGPDGFGKYSLAVFYFELLVSLTATAVGFLLTREIARRPERIGELLLDAGALTGLLAIVSAGGICILCAVCGYSAETTAAIRVASLAILPAALGAVAEAAFIALERAEYVTFGTILEGTLRLVTSFVLVRADYPLVDLFWALVAIRLFLLALYALGLRRQARFCWQFHAPRFFEFVRQWRVFAAEVCLGTIYASLDVIILSLLCDDAVVGVYAAASRLVRPAITAAKSITTAIYPVLARTYQESQDRFERVRHDSLRLMFAIAFPGVIFVSVLPERVIGLVFSAEYLPAVPVLRVLVWSLLLGFLNPLLNQALFASNRQHRSLLVAAVSLGFNGLATWWFVDRWGALGAAWSVVVSLAVAFGCYCLLGLERRDVGRLLLLGSRSGLAAAGLGVALFALRESPWAIVIAAGVAVYVSLLLALRVVTAGDFKILLGRTRLSSAAPTP